MGMGQIPPDKFEDRVRRLTNSTLLSEREAQMFVLHHEEQVGPTRIGDLLSLAPSTVSEYLKRLRHKRHEAGEVREQAENTLELFEGGDSGGDE